MIKGFDEKKLLEMDLRSFNEGKNPYSENDSSLDRAFSRGATHYRRYVQERVGISGNGRVLDLLCGFGRWAPFLAECNDHVIGIDVLEGCVKVAEGMCRELGLENVDFLTGDVGLTKTFPDNHFDCVWMWSGLQYVHRGFTLSEIFRILKPGGRVYVGAYNGPGLMLDHVTRGAQEGDLNTGSSQWALNALVHGEMWNGNPNFLSPEGAYSVLRAFGFTNIIATEEGALSLAEEGNVRSDFTSRKNDLGLSKTIEFVATKPLMPNADNSFVLSLLSGSPDEQNLAFSLLLEEGTATPDTLLDWLGHPDPYVQQTVRRVLIARGETSVEILVAALNSCNQTAQMNGRSGLLELGLSAVGRLLSLYTDTSVSEERKRIKEVLSSLLGVGQDGKYLRPFLKGRALKLRKWPWKSG